VESRESKEIRERHAAKMVFDRMLKKAHAWIEKNKNNAGPGKLLELIDILSPPDSLSASKKR
jgi:hypothetical protein